MKSLRLNGSDLNTVNAATMIRSSPMTNIKTSSTSSRRHCTRHPMEARCDNKSKKKNSRGWWRQPTDEIGRKVDRAIVVRFRRSRCWTLYFSIFWMQWWVQIEEIPMSDVGLYRSVKRIYRDHSQSYDGLVVTWWDYYRYWWIYQIWRSSIAGQ